MIASQLIADRFEIERLAGAGGMGIVYRARDRLGGTPVAIKMMARLDEVSSERFDKEAQILAELDHPRIVRYVAHGRTPAGQYIAMEWLEGETLADRLLRDGPLTVSETVELGGAVARTLAVLHGRGMVHRDIKPSNIFLVGRSLDGMKLLDFGIARHGGKHATMTRSGAVVGTPGYVAPEQAQGSRGVDARADVFALGAVLHECLTGRPAFVAGNILALLAKILLEEAPRASELVPDLPPPLDALLARMLAKDPALRPVDGAAVAIELMLAAGPDAPPPPGREATSITTGEQRLLSVILATLRPAADDSALDAWDEAPPAEEVWGATRAIDPDAEGAASDAPGDPGPPFRAEAPSSAGEPAPSTRSLAEAQGRLRALAEAHGASLEELAEGSLVVTLKAVGSATDLAARAARLALALRERLPEAPMALATGRGMLALRFPVGEAIDGAARLLRQVLDEGGGGRAIRIDDTTAGLLDARFEVGGDRRGLELLGERSEPEAGRTLLGKRSPFIGREREIAFLVGLYDECVAEPRARPVLVTGPAGAGKSRLVAELAARLATRDPAPEIWIARGDPSRASSPFGMLAPALRRAAGILDGEPLEVRRQKLRARVQRHVGRDDATRVAEFIGELVGARFDDEERVQLRAARRELSLMGDQMRRAFEDWVAAEAGAAPLVILLEDLHWGDLPTVKFLDAALRHVADRPMLVVAVARPEAQKQFPGLWAERGLQELRLGELTRRSSEKLVRAMLGEVEGDVLARLVERAGGNALYLEELIRAVAEGREELPPTVLAMVASRLEGLEPEARRLLRAASVYGEVFWRGGVAALVGGEAREVTEWLRVLVARELVVRRQEHRFPGEDEYTFGHGLMRDAAYALLTEADRVLGHRLAAGWLEAAGEVDAATLADHLSAGEAGERAVPLYLRAAGQALEGNDFAAAWRHVARGLDLGAEGPLRGELLEARADAGNWLGEFAAAEEAAGEAMRLLPRAGPAWFRAIGQLAVSCARRGNVARLAPLPAELGALCAGSAGTLSREALEALVQSAARVANHLILGGRRDLGAPLLAAAERAGAEVADPAVTATILATRSAEALYRGEPETCYQLALQAADDYLRAGSLRLASVQKANAAFAGIEGGAYAEAEAVLRELLPLALRLGIPNIVASTQHNLGLVLVQRGQLAEAAALELAAIEILRRQGDHRLEGSARVYLAMALHRGGDAAAAAVEAEAAVRLLEVAPPLRASAQACLAAIRLDQGRPAEARQLAEAALAILTRLGSLEEGESLVRLVDVLTLEATGRHAEARAALAVAAARVLARAEGLRAWRQRFLADIPENARTLALAQDRGVMG